MVAEAGNFFVVLPFMFTAVAALVVIWFAMRTERKGPSVPNLTARRKHPLRHLQVELNRVKKDVRDKAAEEAQEDGDQAGEAQAREAQAQGAGDRPKKRRRGDDGPRLRRLK